MEKYITMLSDRNPNRNEGYSWVMRETVYVPIVKTCLSITKRSSFLLPLLDEMTLRLIAEGVNEIEEISNILGISRKLLDITIADLYTKDLVYCSAGRCTLRPKGREVLQKLKVVRRKKDTIKNVYYDPINKKVLAEYNTIQFVENVLEQDKKLEVEFEKENIEVFKENIDSINEIFLEEMDIYNDRTKAEPDELLSIDSVEKVFVKFIRFPIYIYVSDSGRDIDVLLTSDSMKSLFQEYRAKIVEQIRQRKLFKDKFYKYKIEQTFDKPEYGVNLEIKTIIENHKGRKWTAEEKEDFFATEVLTSRKIYDDEFDLLLMYLCNDSNKITIMLSHLDEWKNKEIIKQILAIIGDSKLEKIIYSSCKQLDKCVQCFERIILKCKTKMEQGAHKEYIQLCFDDKFVITGIPVNVNILDEETYIHKIDFFLEKVE